MVRTIRAHALDTIAVSALVLLAGVLRLVGLATPTRPVFDEIYYAVNGCVRVLGAPACGVDGLASSAHPPAGELLIGAGQVLFGHNAFGWRIAPALAGVALVLLTYLIARRLFAGWRHAVVASFSAGALVAVDGMSVAMSRVAMLDIFMATFAAAAVAATLFGSPSARWRQPALVLAGVALGLALATKWSAVLVVPLLISITAVRAPHGERIATAWRGALLIGVTAGAVYVAIFATSLSGSITQWPYEFAQRHVRMLAFHRSLAGHHPYESSPLGWLLLQRPVVLHFAAGVAPDGSPLYRYLMALGNPVIWWSGAVGVTAAVITLLRRQITPAAVVVAGGLAACWLPWFILGAGRSQIFGYYLLPAVPFLALGAIYALGTLVRRFGRNGQALAFGWLVLVAIASAVLLPLSLEAVLTPESFEQRVIFDCPAGSSAPQLPADDEVQEGEPPAGWCWG